MYLSFDPGETTGWCSLNEQGIPTGMGALKGDEALYEFLDNVDPIPKVVVIEEFKLYGNKAKQQIGSTMKTSQTIGIIRAYTRKWKSEVVIQPASIKKIAELWTGVSPKGSHANSHHIDAFNHAMYYLQKNGIVESRATYDK
jgi:hypothetical protein